MDEIEKAVEHELMGLAMGQTTYDRAKPVIMGVITAALEEAKRENEILRMERDTMETAFDKAEAALQSAEAKGYARGVEEAIDAAPTQRRGVVETMLIARQALLDYASRTVDPDLRSGLAVLKALVPAPAVEPVATTTEKESTDE
jgi:hypothetical protein